MGYLLYNSSVFKATIMSYTIAINGKGFLDGSIVLGSLAKTSAGFHDPYSAKKAEGYISVNGKTCVGLAFVAGKNGIKVIRERLERTLEIKGGKVLIRLVKLGLHEMCVVNLLVLVVSCGFWKTRAGGLSITMRF